ncbi:MAG: C13 family peptidase [Nitrospira sp.]
MKTSSGFDSLRTWPAQAAQVGADLSQNLRSGLALFFFQRIPGSAFTRSLDQLALLLLFDVAVAVLFSYVRAGGHGLFRHWSLSIIALYLLFLLLAGWLISRMTGEEDLVLSLPLILASTYLPYEMLTSSVLLSSRMEWTHGQGLPSLVLPVLAAVWIGSALYWTFSHTFRLRAPIVFLSLALFCLTMFAPRYYFPVNELWWQPEANDSNENEGPVSSVTDEATFYAQAAMLPQQLAQVQPGEPDHTDLYFIGMAPYAAQDVFIKEIRSIQDLFASRFDTAGKSVTLANHKSAWETVPIASMTSLRASLRAVGSAMNRDEDILFLYITTHGSRTHDLSVELSPLELSSITPETLKAALDESSITWKVVVISACYSGGYIEPLRDDHTLVITAADATHTSFGCGNQFDYTYFGEAYFDKGLRQTYSFVDAFDEARASIAAREAAEKLTASNPQMSVSPAMRAKLKEFEAALQHRRDAHALVTAAPH